MGQNWAQVYRKMLLQPYTRCSTISLPHYQALFVVSSWLLGVVPGREEVHHNIMKFIGKLWVVDWYNKIVVVFNVNRERVANLISVMKMTNLILGHIWEAELECRPAAPLSHYPNNYGGNEEILCVLYLLSSKRVKNQTMFVFIQLYRRKQVLSAFLEQFDNILHILLLPLHRVKRHCAEPVRIALIVFFSIDGKYNDHLHHGAYPSVASVTGKSCDRCFIETLHNSQG